MKIFTAQEIENAKHHKYNGTDDSILVKLFLRKWWNWLIEFVPMTLAPNMITLIGFLFEIGSFLISFIVSNCMDNDIPGWLCIVNGLCLFIYSTLDNLDGRQARRTGSSSPLGQFFDHGCDAITGVCELMKVAISLDMGCDTICFFFVFLMGVGFFMTSYEEYVTGAFYLGPINGPDEGLLLLSGLHILLGLGLPKKLVLNGFVYFGFAACFVATIWPIMKNVLNKSKGDREMKNRAIVGLIPAIIYFIIFVLNPLRSEVCAESPFYVMAAGLAMQYLSQVTIVSHIVLRPPIKLCVDPSIIFVAIVGIVSMFITKEDILFWYWVVVCCVFFLAMVFYDVSVIVSLSKGLGIPIFTIKPKPVEQIEEPLNQAVSPDEVTLIEGEAGTQEVAVDSFKETEEDEEIV